MRNWRVAEFYAGLARSWQALSSWKNAELCLLIDVSDSAREIYLANHPSAPYITGDLNSFSPAVIQQLANGPIDILLGCPPCQGFSDTGKRDPEDVMNRHISRFGEYIDALKPKVVAMENVPLLAASVRYKEFTAKLETLGYHWDAAILNAALYGSCQSRQRLIFVAAKDSLPKPAIPTPTHGSGKSYYNYSTGEYSTFIKDPLSLLGKTPGTTRVKDSVRYVDSPLGPITTPSVWDVIGDLQNLTPNECFRMSHQPWKHTADMLRRMSEVPEGRRWSGGEEHFSQSYGRLHRDGLARTITCSFPNPGSGRFWHPVEDRCLTLREAARIQGIEDDFIFSGPPSRSATLVGNALDFSLARAAAQAVVRIFDQSANRVFPEA